MKIKTISCFALAVVSLFVLEPCVEARTHFSLNIGGLFAPAPAPVVYEERIVEHYAAPMYAQPYYYDAPRVVYAPPRVYTRQVYARPQPVYSGFSFGWFR